MCVCAYVCMHLYLYISKKDGHPEELVSRAAQLAAPAQPILAALEALWCHHRGWAPFESQSLMLCLLPCSPEQAAWDGGHCLGFLLCQLMPLASYGYAGRSLALPSLEPPFRGLETEAGHPPPPPVPQPLLSGHTWLQLSLCTPCAPSSGPMSPLGQVRVALPCCTSEQQHA